MRRNSDSSRRRRCPNDLRRIHCHPALHFRAWQLHRPPQHTEPNGGCAAFRKRGSLSISSLRSDAARGGSTGTHSGSAFALSQRNEKAQRSPIFAALSARPARENLL